MSAPNPNRAAEIFNRDIEAKGLDAALESD